MTATCAHAGRKGCALLGALLIFISCRAAEPVDSAAPAEASAKAKGEVIARIDGQPIYRSEVERRAAWRLYRAEVDLHLILKQETDRIIDERLSEQAALDAATGAQRSSTPAASRQLPPVTESEIDAYLEAHPSEVPQEIARPRIRHYLEESRRVNHELGLSRARREASDIEILFSPPTEPRIHLDLSGAPVRGPRDGSVTIVLFGDLSSPETAAVATEVEKMRTEHPDEIRVVFRSLPRSRDEIGLKAAQLAAGAQTQERFWRFFDRSTAMGGLRGEEALLQITENLGPPPPAAAQTSPRAELIRVQEDLRFARDAGVHRAPTLFVNGRYLAPQSGVTAIRALIREELETQTAPHPD